MRGRLNGVLRYLLPRLVQLVSYLIFRTSRIRFVDRELEDRCLENGGQIIFAGLHEAMMMLPYHFRDRTAGVVMVSGSRDGDIIADTVDRFGMRAVRGSSRRGGRQALDLMIEALRGSGVSAGVIVDGPRGPARIAKSGAVMMARATGLPIVPGTWWTRPLVRVRSWDRTIVPLPFSRIAFAFAEPLYVAADADPAAIEAARDELTRRLEQARAKAQAALR
ncbi:MAG: lysophospholipid acyltransferase family protein [Deltaproteobacteria bacterium]|nr:lysophospholipid acyltransferase family protein [Deltaproteobacteria bacterium]